MSRRETCDLCGHIIDTGIETHYREVRGWAKTRTQGGTNALVFRTELAGVRCAGCVESAKLGIAAGQLSIDSERGPE